MGHQISTPAKIYVAHFDISGDLNAYTVARTVEAPEDTGFGDSMKQRVVGLQKAAFSIAGMTHRTGVVDGSASPDIDQLINARMGTASVPLLIAQNGVAGNAPCEFGPIIKGQYSTGATIGELEKFTCAGELSDNYWTRGNILWPAATAVTGTADGTAYELGAVAAGQYVHGVLLVLADDFSDLTVKIQSDTVGFGSATDRITFTAASGLTSQITRTAGAITDTYWRASVSAFTGTTATILVAMAIK